MDASELLARIAAEPGMMGGKPVIRGRRITPAMVLNMLAAGATREAVLEAYPALEPEDIDACLIYAARLSEKAAAEGLTVAAEQVRVLADTNVVAHAVRAMRSAGHDVVYGAERTEDPGDRALLAEAHAGGRILLTKDHDLGALVHRDDLPHFGVMLIDDLGDPAAEVRLILSALLSHAGRLAEGAFLRVTPSGVRESQASPSSQGNVFHVAACFAVAAGEAESIYHDDHSYR